LEHFPLRRTSNCHREHPPESAAAHPARERPVPVPAALATASECLTREGRAAALSLMVSPLCQNLLTLVGPLMAEIRPGFHRRCGHSLSDANARDAPCGVEIDNATPRRTLLSRRGANQPSIPRPAARRPLMHVHGEIERPSFSLWRFIGETLQFGLAEGGTR
jgi:hypothetical protein